MQIKEKIGLIGVGNMGGSILEGLIKNNMASASQIWIYDKISEKVHEFSHTWKVHAAASNAEVLKNADLLILAVKPQDLAETAREIQELFRPSHIVISILAGTPIQKVRSCTGPKPLVVRAMPNLGAKVGQSITAVTGESDHALSLAELIFESCGKTMRLEEKYFDLVTALSGSGPAYFFHLMELMAAEAVRGGIPEEQARLLAVQTALGAASLAESSGEAPEELRKKVTSKGGTTEAALKILESKKFPQIFHDAIEAAEKRGRELSKG